jgi:hypothetical protein
MLMHTVLNVDGSTLYAYAGTDTGCALALGGAAFPIPVSMLRFVTPPHAPNPPDEKSSVNQEAAEAVGTG